MTECNTGNKLIKILGFDLKKVIFIKQDILMVNQFLFQNYLMDNEEIIEEDLEVIIEEKMRDLMINKEDKWMIHMKEI